MCDADTCGLRANGTIVCWGVDPQETMPLTSPTGTFLQISLAEEVFCGLHSDGSTVTCWGITLTLGP